MDMSSLKRLIESWRRSEEYQNEQQFHFTVKNYFFHDFDELERFSDENDELL